MSSSIRPEHAEKKQKYRTARKPSIEIDLSRVNRDISKADLTKLLLGDGCNPRELFKWIYHPAYDSAVMAAEYDELLKIQKEKERQETIRLESKEKAKQLELREKEDAERIALEAENEKKRLKLELKESLRLRADGNKLPDWRQDLVWYHDVHKGKMRAIDWEYRRKQLSERCEHLDKVIQDLSGQITKERIARNLENEEKKKQWLKTALVNQSKGLTLTGIQQDLVWYYEVVNGRMAAIDWVKKRNTAEARCFFLDKETIKYNEEVSQAEAEERAIKAEKESAEMKRTAKLERHKSELIYAEINAYKEEADRKEIQRQRKIAKAEAKEKALAKAAKQAEKNRLSKLCSDSNIIHKKLIAEHFRRRKAGLPYDPEEAKRAIAKNMGRE